jgi:hypothetical protein
MTSTTTRSRSQRSRLGGSRTSGSPFTTTKRNPAAWCFLRCRRSRRAERFCLPSGYGPHVAHTRGRGQRPRILLDGLARDAQVVELLGELESLHPRNDTFPGEVLLHLAADALDWCRASRTNPLPLEGLQARFLPELSFRGRQNKKLQYAVLAAAALHGEPNRTCSRRSPGGRPMTSGSTPSTPRSPTSAPPPATQASPYARHARTWPSAWATPRHNTHYGAGRKTTLIHESPSITAARRVLSLIFSVTQCDATIGPTAESTAGPAGGRGAPSARADGEWAAGCCPILGAKWERRFTVRCGQMRSDAVIVALPKRSNVRKRP